MSDGRHLSTEEISALLDRGADRAADSDHLEACSSCRREMELLRRMRMALSALDDRSAPAGTWASIEAELEERGRVDPAGSGRSVAGEASPAGDDGGPGGSGPWADMPWLRAAAAILLFVGGLGLGTALSSPGGAAGDAAAADAAADVASSTRGGPAEAVGAGAGGGGPEGDGAVGGTAGGEGTGSRLVASGGADASGTDELSYREAMQRLERLRARGPSPGEVYRNPRAAAEHLARLDALMRASREALQEDPADPAVNDFLFQVAEERRELNRALRLSSLEYR